MEMTAACGSIRTVNPDDLVQQGTTAWQQGLDGNMFIVWAFLCYWPPGQAVAKSDLRQK